MARRAGLQTATNRDAAGVSVGPLGPAVLATLEPGGMLRASGLSLPVLVLLGAGCLVYLGAALPRSKSTVLMLDGAAVGLDAVAATQARAR